MEVNDNRSSSEQMVDLHVFVIPRHCWRSDVQWAYNAACLEALSAGFVRVKPDISLQTLREEISVQLDEHIIPESYVYLRTLGQCLAVVSDKQEVSLKVKYYVPPQAPCPEIFVLPHSGVVVSSMSLERLDVIGKQRRFQWEEESLHHSSARPCSVASPRHHAGQNHTRKVTANHLSEYQTDETNGSTLFSQHLQQSPVPPSHGSTARLLVKGQSPSPEREWSHVSKSHSTSAASDGKLQQPTELQHAANETTRWEDYSHPAVIVHHPSDSSSSTNNKSKQDVYKQPYRSELIKEEAPERDYYSTYHGQHSKSPVVNYLRTESQWESASNSSEGSDAPVIHPLDGVENSQLDEKHLQAVTAQLEAALFGDSNSPQDPENTVNTDSMAISDQNSQPLSQKQKEHADDGETSQPLSHKQNTHNDLTGDGTNSQPLSHKQNTRNDLTGDGTNSQSLSQKQEYIDQTGNGTNNEESAGKTEALSKYKEQHPQEVVTVDSTKPESDSNSKLNHGSKAAFSNKTKTKQDPKGATASNTRQKLMGQSVKQRGPHSKRDPGQSSIRPSKTTGFSSSSNHMNSTSSKLNHDQQPVGAANQRSKEAREIFSKSGQQSRAEVDHDRGKQEPVAGKKSSEGSSEEDRLLAELKALQQSRVNLGQNHARLVNEAKALQVKSQRYRQETESSWKKKYLSEKKRTRHLEQQCGKLRQQLHLVLAQNRVDKQTAKGQKTFIPGSKAPSQANNMKIQCAKVKDEVAKLRQKVEQAKARLAAQFQTRERLETEVKTLKQEVVQKKINLSLVRSKVH